MIRLTILRCLGIITVCLLTSCDDRSGGAKLADKGIATAATIETFYDTLATHEEQTLWLMAFRHSLPEAAPDNATVAASQKIIVALKNRSAMAHALGKAYAGLKGLTSADVEKNTGDAVEKFAGALQAAADHPVSDAGQAGASLLGQMARDVIVMIQSHKLQERSAELAEILTSLGAAMEKEKVSYIDAIKFHQEESYAAVKTLLHEGIADPWPLLDYIYSEWGLAAPSDDAAAAEIRLKLSKDENFQGRIESVLQTIDRQRADAANETVDSLKDALESLAKAHKAFEAKQPADLDQISSFLTRAESYMDLFAKLRKSPKNN